MHLEATEKQFSFLFGAISLLILIGVVNYEAESSWKSAIVLYWFVVLVSAGSVQVCVDEWLHGVKVQDQFGYWVSRIGQNFLGKGLLKRVSMRAKLKDQLPILEIQAS